MARRNFIGAIPNKLQLDCLSNKETQLFLYMVGLIHLPGTRKHGYFNWQNDPEHTDSTISNNLSALCRHFCMVREGRWMDPEGYPHIFHMACRVSMLITTYVRQYQYSNSLAKNAKMAPPTKGCILLTDAGFTSNWTLETLFSLALMNELEISDIDLGTYHTFLMQTLEWYYIKQTSEREDRYLIKTGTDRDAPDLTFFDVLFFSTVKFVTKHWLDHKVWYCSQCDPNKYSQEEKDLFDRIVDLSLQ